MRADVVCPTWWAGGLDKAGGNSGEHGHGQPPGPQQWRWRMKIFRQLVWMALVPPRRALLWLYSLIAVKDTVLGIRTIDMIAVNETESRLLRVAAALQLLNESAPIWLRRMRRHFHMVAIHGHKTAYSPDLRLCVLNGADIDRWSTNAVAVALAHETTHAIIEASGHSYHQKSARIERACAQAELRLAKRLGDAELIEEATGVLDRMSRGDGQVEVEPKNWLGVNEFPEWFKRARRFTKGYRVRE